MALRHREDELLLGAVRVVSVDEGEEGCEVGGAVEEHGPAAAGDVEHGSLNVRVQRDHGRAHDAAERVAVVAGRGGGVGEGAAVGPCEPGVLRDAEACDAACEEGHHRAGGELVCDAWEEREVGACGQGNGEVGLRESPPVGGDGDRAEQGGEVGHKLGDAGFDAALVAGAAEQAVAVDECGRWCGGRECCGWHEEEEGALDGSVLVERAGGVVPVERAGRVGACEEERCGEGAADTERHFGVHCLVGDARVGGGCGQRREERCGLFGEFDLGDGEGGRAVACEGPEGLAHHDAGALRPDLRGGVEVPGGDDGAAVHAEGGEGGEVALPVGEVVVDAGVARGLVAEQCGHGGCGAEALAGRGAECGGEADNEALLFAQGRPGPDDEGRRGARRCVAVELGEVGDEGTRLCVCEQDGEVGSEGECRAGFVGEQRGVERDAWEHNDGGVGGEAVAPVPVGGRDAIAAVVGGHDLVGEVDSPARAGAGGGLPVGGGPGCEAVRAEDGLAGCGGFCRAVEDVVYGAVGEVAGVDGCIGCGAFAGVGGRVGGAASAGCEEEGESGEAERELHGHLRRRRWGQRTRL